MSTEYRARVFKSGNSLALRLPKALGLKAGAEMILREKLAGFTAEPVAVSAPKLDISGFWGKAKGLTVPPREDFEERPSASGARREADGGA